MNAVHVQTLRSVTLSIWPALLKNKRIASSDASLPKGDRRSRGLQEELESGTVLGTTLRSMQQPMRRISWAASLCLPLPVDNNDTMTSTKGFLSLAVAMASCSA